jgi:hypothetical protein
MKFYNGLIGTGLNGQLLKHSHSAILFGINTRGAKVVKTLAERVPYT